MHYDEDNLCGDTSLGFEGASPLDKIQWRARVICHRTYKNGLYIVNNVEIIFVPIMY